MYSGICDFLEIWRFLLNGQIEAGPGVRTWKEADPAAGSAIRPYHPRRMDMGRAIWLVRYAQTYPTQRDAPLAPLNPLSDKRTQDRIGLKQVLLGTLGRQGPAFIRLRPLSGAAPRQARQSYVAIPVVSTSSSSSSSSSSKPSHGGLDSCRLGARRQ